jgi:hypothetical protein
LSTVAIGGRYSPAPISATVPGSDMLINNSFYLQKSLDDFFSLYNSMLHNTYFVKLSELDFNKDGLFSSFLFPLVLAPSLRNTVCPIAICIDG